MPAEWEPHEAVWLAWPHDEITFPGRLGKVEDDIAAAIKAIYQSERVELLVLNEGMKAKAWAKLGAAAVDLARVNFRITNYVDGWMRDCGPIFVVKKNQVVMTKWQFNSWGGKFPDLLPDAAIPDAMKEWLNLAMLEVPLVLEAGSIEVNGQGLCLTTEQCLLNSNRNPGKTKKEIEKVLSDYLGIEQTIWLEEGLVNDHTDGHIDELARFVSPRAVVCAYEDDPEDENYQILKKNWEVLQKIGDLEIIKLPMPHLQFDDGTKAPVSYTNFYIGNTIVLAPTFGDPNDQRAHEILQSQFPNRKVIGIDCRDIIYGGGAIHCLTQQQPK